MLIDGIQCLTRSNFKLYCAKCYQNFDNPDFDSLENDLYNASHTKRLISNYAERGEVKDRLILNYIIILSNLFGPEHAVRILFFRIDRKHHSILKTYLTYLNFMPDVVLGLKKIILDKDLPLDRSLFKRLEKL